MVYITKDGDTIDYIAWKYYGHTDSRAVEQVLDANVGIASAAAELSPGIEINLPDLVAATDTSGVKLWD